MDTEYFDELAAILGHQSWVWDVRRYPDEFDVYKDKNNYLEIWAIQYNGYHEYIMRMHHPSYTDERVGTFFPGFRQTSLVEEIRNIFKRY